MTVSPERTSRSQRGDDETAPGSPAVSWVKSYCIRTPCPGVAMTAAYAEPAWTPALTMIPAFAHGCGTVLPSP